MAFSLNKIMLIGNLGRDCETRFTTNNVSITNFSIATTHSYKGQDGNWVNETTWHNITAFNLGDFYKDGLKKGAKVYVEGRLTKREYTDKEGIKRQSTNVNSEKIILLDKTDRDNQTTEDTHISNSQDQGNNQDNNDDLPF